jgi:hypothetical protein
VDAIAITALDLDATLERLSTFGTGRQRSPYSVRKGGSPMCFVCDPNGYRVEIIEPA